MTTYTVTWVDAAGNAACLGRDETITTDSTAEELAEDATYSGVCDGIDVDRYHVEIEKI